MSGPHKGGIASDFNPIPANFQARHCGKPPPPPVLTQTVKAEQLAKRRVYTCRDCSGIDEKDIENCSGIDQADIKNLIYCEILNEFESL